MVCMGKEIATIIAVLCSLNCIAQKEKVLIAHGNELYKKQDYNKAAEQYQQATQANSKNPKAQYNLGNAWYKTKKLEEAEGAFNTAAESYKEPLLKSKSYYNKGVALTRQTKLQESIDAYKQSLRLNPNDREARENLQKALNELKKQQQQQNNNQDKKDNNEDKQKKPKEEKNNSKLNKKQVGQQLNNLRQEEKRLQQSMQKKNNPGSTNSKDW